LTPVSLLESKLGVEIIDYKCDDEKKTLELGRHLGIIA
jgi:hypothetical protein